MASQREQDRSLGEQLKALRMAAGLSQEQLAADAGLDQSLVSKIERLGPGAAAWHRVCRIAEVLGYQLEVQLRASEE
jgi:transcriptional regulator with XRE-family HTH domain